MMDEAAGKILGMAMAYGVSSLGLFLAYVSYRRRTAAEEPVMTPVAWGVVTAVVLVVAGGVLVVARLAERPAAEVPAAVAPEVTTIDEPPVIEPAAVEQLPPLVPQPPAAEHWRFLGMVLPALIFLVATWVTVAMYLHFSRSGPP